MRCVIVESPHKAKTLGESVRNVLYARLCLSDCLRRGESPYASHLLYTQPNILNDAVPEERKMGIEAGLAWGSRADATVVYTDLGVSDGMQKGIERAESEKRPVEHRTLHPDLFAIVQTPDSKTLELYGGILTLEETARSLFRGVGEYQKKKKQKKVFLISPVRNALPALNEQIGNYVKELENERYAIHWPSRDTVQVDPSGGYEICRTNFRAILEADEIHVWYDETSGGSKFDMGGVFMLVAILHFPKKIVIANEHDVVDNSQKSFFKVLQRLAVLKDTGLDN